MVKLFFRNLSKSFCVYLLTIANLVHAVQNDSYDWLLAVSLFLSLLSIALNFAAAIREWRRNA